MRSFDVRHTGRSPHTGSQTNNKKWEFDMGGRVSGSSAAIGADETIYVGCDDNKFYAINPDGSEKWEFDTGDWINSSSAIDADGTIYIGSNSGKLYALNPDGSRKWDFPTGGWVTSSPAIGSDGTIYIGSNDCNLYAINPADGSEKWRFDTGLLHQRTAGTRRGRDDLCYLNLCQEALRGKSRWHKEVGVPGGRGHMRARTHN